MEKRGFKNFSFPAIKTLAIIAAVLSVGFLSACGKKSSGGNKVNVGGYGTCTNCAGWAGSTLVSSFKAQNAEGTILINNMELLANSTYTNQYPQNAGAGTAYYGQQQVMIQGAIHFTQLSTSYNGCQVPAGTYNVTTLQAGEYQNTFFTIPLARATGPADIEFTITGVSGTGQAAFLYQKDSGVQKSMTGTITVTKANGFVCSPDFYDVVN